MKLLLTLSFTICLSVFAFQAGPVPSIEPLSLPTPKAKLSPVDPSQVLVVNMIPSDHSEEQGQDSEPFLAVNSSGLMIGAVYYGESMAGRTSPPLFLSTNNGENWKMISIITAKHIGSQTYCFSDNGTSFYGSILAFDEGANANVSVFHTDDPGNNNPLQSISTLSSGSQFADQPFIQARSVEDDRSNTEDARSSGTGPRSDRIYVGQNYLGSELGGRTASVRVSVDSGKTFRLLGVEARETGSAGQDGPEVRPALANDETVYVGFLHWKVKNGERFSGDVVVSRDDQAAAGKNSFLSLTEPEDGLPGRIVAKNREFSLTAYLGKQRVGSGLSLAVDPNQSGAVCVAWVDYERTKSSVIHLKRSTDRGQNWSDELLTVPSATNPALAISNRGVVGLLYQQLSEDRWETHFRASDDGLQWSDIVLSSFPTASEPAKLYDPYLGDKVHLLSINGDFYGVFSAPNIPEQKYFPQGVRFQRNYSEGKLLSRDGRSVFVSIDPYFFRVSSKVAANFISASLSSTTPTPPNRLETKFTWLLVIAAIPLLVLVLHGVVQYYRAPVRLEQLLEKKGYQAPALTNYEGFVAARFTDSAGHPITESSPGSNLRLSVEFTREQPPDNWAEIRLEGGKDPEAGEVAFTIVIDSSDFKVEPPQKPVSVPAKNSAKFDFWVSPRRDRSEANLFVQVYQATQLVQVVPARLLISNTDQPIRVGAKSV